MSIRRLIRFLLRRRPPVPRPVPSPHVADPGDFGLPRDVRYVWPGEDKL
jgi:hypothetical protein